jgi:hypothetical protein
MLEPVAANQTRFVAPGLSADSRGVALGRFCVILLPSIDRVVGLFRGMSERGSLDDLLPSMQVLQVTTPLKSKEFLIQLPVSNSHMADGIAAVSTLMGGLTFTGSSKHFVKFRDSRAPLGYDVDSLHGGRGDYILYASEFVQAYSRDREIPFARLALNLSLEVERNDQLRPEERALLRVEPGLWRVTTSYLHRNNMPCEVAACDAAPTRPGEEPRRFYLIRCRLQQRMEQLFRATPGVEVYRMLTDRAAVQVGFRHPLELNSCSNIFDQGSLYLYSGDRDRLDLVRGDGTADGLAFVSARSLVQLGQPARVLQTEELARAKVEGLIVPLRLVIAGGPRPPVRACRVPLAQAEWLKKLVYLLPPQVLEGYSVCSTADSIFLYNETEVEFIPLGNLFYQVAMGILVPVGYELQPRVHPDVLVQHLGGGRENLLFFRLDDPMPVQLPRSAFGPLTRQALAHVELQPLQPMAVEAASTAAASVSNDPVGTFPLWGFSPRTPKSGDDGEGEA